MSHKTLLIILIILLLAVSAYFLKINLTGNVIETNTYTTAICNESNFCQDYIITCQDRKIIEKTPITGAIIQKSEDWQDTRENKELCD